MESNCPICNQSVGGVLVSPKESSLLKSWYKVCYSILVPVPFVGAYIGGKIHDFLNSLSSSGYKHLCPTCKCHWIDTQGTSDLKISGNNKLIAVFCDDTFVVGVIEKNFYIMQTQNGPDIKTTVVYMQGNDMKRNTYLNGYSCNSITSFGKLEISEGVYCGETNHSLPNGWGFVYAKNGFLYYGKWTEGNKDGIMFSVSLDGRTNNVEYWKNGVLINL